jgi:uncharacterized protein (DUF1330 family)
LIIDHGLIKAATESGSAVNPGVPSMIDPTAYLLLLARASDRSFSDYVAALPALHQRHGGHFAAVAPAPMVEQYGHNGSAHAVMLSGWPSLQQSLSFWQSAAHGALLRRFSTGAMVAIAIEAEAGLQRSSDTEALAVFLGSGPTPALLEAAGAQALALVRERHVTALQGHWTHGDVAIYGWNSERDARQQLVAFSSGQRGRAMLLPGLQTIKRTANGLQQGREFGSMLLQAS